MKPLDLSGHRFGSVVAVRQDGKTSDGKIKWEFICDCGIAFSCSGSRVKRGEVFSCPECSKKRVAKSRTTHGLRQTPEYRIWTHIKSRCLNSNVPEFKSYGGRGISICDQWIDSFENFISDMGNRPSPHHSIDRINNNGNYEPSNCRWATQETQANNTRKNKKIEINGEKKKDAECAIEAGLNSQIVYKRQKRGHSGVNLVLPRRELMVFEFNGVAATIPEWSRLTGIKSATLYWRINKQRWSIEESLTKGAAK
jgi:DNA-directed RNA polymerase subunit RPC12/RpoP